MLQAKRGSFNILLFYYTRGAWLRPALSTVHLF